MARPAKKDPGRTGPEVIDKSTPEMLREQSVVATHERALALIDERFGFGGAYDREHVLRVAEGLIMGLASHAFFLGRALLLLREHEPDASWTECIGRLQMNERTARRYVAIARKYDGLDGKKLLAARLPAAKLLELVAQDDEALEALGQGGLLAGHTLDEIESMSTRELKEALRAARQEREQLEQQLERKDKKINELDRKASRLDKATFDEAVLEMLDELAALVNRADDALTTLYGGAARVKEYFKDNGTRMDDETRARMNVIHGFVESHLKKLAKAIPSA